MAADVIGYSRLVEKTRQGSWRGHLEAAQRGLPVK
jgi:hypothetical protein